ncbi:MAG: phage major capsid protein [Alphaproteobacteria bacterium]|nr:phage major capsid protein [Alphaproteobacteria bacterium]
MIDMNDVQTAAETLGRAFEEYKDTNDRRLSALESKGSTDVLYDDKLRRLDGTITTLQTDISQMKTAMRRPAGATALPQPREESEYKQAFLRYVTKGHDQDLAALQSKASVLTDPEGGYSVPAELSERIVTRQFDTTPMRQLATVMSVSSDAVEMLRDTNEAEASWVSELATRSDTDQGSIGRIRIPVFELHAQPRATQKLLDDAVINIEEWMIGKVADRFARRENAAFVTGDGVTQPRGFTSYTTAATGDATRSWGVLEHVNTTADGAFPASNPADKLIELMHKLKAGYQPKAAWLMPRAVSEAIRKFKENTTSAYIWQPGLQAGQPATLLGFPIHLAEDMPTLAAGSLSLAFGNFGDGYTIVDRIGVRILRDPYTAAPFVKFRCSKRVGGDVTNFEAIKLLRFSAT